MAKFDFDGKVTMLSLTDRFGATIVYVAFHPKVDFSAESSPVNHKTSATRPSALVRVL